MDKISQIITQRPFVSVLLALALGMVASYLFSRFYIYKSQHICKPCEDGLIDAATSGDTTAQQILRNRLQEEKAPVSLKIVSYVILGALIIYGVGYVASQSGSAGSRVSSVFTDSLRGRPTIV